MNDTIPDRNGNHRNDAQLFEVAFNSEILLKADLQTDRQAARSLTFNYSIARLSLDDIAARIQSRHNITSICIDEATGRFHRAKKHFKRTSFIGVDIDNGPDEKYLSWQEALKHPFVKRYCSIAYTTASHSPELHKFRLMFFLDDPIESIVRAEQIIEAAIWLFGSDESCSDASRFFYGTGDRGRVIALGNLLTNEGIERLLSDYERAHPKPEPPKSSAGVRPGSESYNVGTSEDRRRAYGERAIESARRTIYDSRPPVGHGPGRIPGNRHEARRAAAYLLGGYVAGGLLSELEAYCALEDAVRANTDNPSSAMQTIRDCLEAGKSEPITFEDKERERETYLATLRKHQPSDEVEELEPGEVPVDPPVSKDPDREMYLRRVLANSSRFTRARMMIARAFDVKLPWRLLNAIHSFQKNSLRIKIISDEMLISRYEQTGQGASLSTLKRDKKKLKKAQEKAGVEFVWYLPGHYNPETEEYFASMYQSHLDRWALEAIDLAITRKGSYQISDEELQAACIDIAGSVPRCEQPKKPPPPEKDAIALELDGEKMTLKGIQQISEAWDVQELTTAERQIRAKALFEYIGPLLVQPKKFKRERQRNTVAAMVRAIMPEEGFKSGHSHNNRIEEGVTENGPLFKGLEPENEKSCKGVMCDPLASSGNGAKSALEREQKTDSATVAESPGEGFKNGRARKTGKNEGEAEKAPLFNTLEPQNGKCCMGVTCDPHARSKIDSKTEQKTGSGTGSETATADPPIDEEMEGFR